MSRPNPNCSQKEKFHSVSRYNQNCSPKEKFHRCMQVSVVMANNFPPVLSSYLSHFSCRRCLSTAGCNPPTVPSVVLCWLLFCSRWFPPSLLHCLAIICLVVLLIFSLSLVATLCIFWSTYCPSFLLYVLPISTFIAVYILYCQISLFFL